MQEELLVSLMYYVQDHERVISHEYELETSLLFDMWVHLLDEEVRQLMVLLGELLVEVVLEDQRIKRIEMVEMVLVVLLVLRYLTQK